MITGVRCPRVLMFLFALLSLVGGASAQVAPEPAGYVELVGEAIAEYDARNYLESRALFEQAHRLFPNARTLRGLGMVAFELRNYVECIAYIEASLAATEKPLEGILRSETMKLLKRAQRFVARLNVTVEPATARIFVDGALMDDAGGTARSLWLAVGEHVLRFEAEGFVTEERTKVVRGGEEDSMQVALSSAPTHAPAVASAEPEPAPAPSLQVSSSELADTGGAPPTPLAPSESSTKLPVYKSPWLWAGVGAAVVVAAVIIGVTAGGGETRTREGETVRTPNTPTDGILVGRWSGP